MSVILPAKGVVSNGFSDSHKAIDIANTNPVDIVAPIGGTITIAETLGQCGLAVQIGTDKNGHRLCHNETLLVKVGQTVKQGQKLGTMGYTGYTVPSGPAGRHVHWVMWVNGVRVDGRKYVYNEAVGKFTKAQIIVFHQAAADGKSPGAGFSGFGYVGKEATQARLDSLARLLLEVNKKYGRPAATQLKSKTLYRTP